MNKKHTYCLFNNQFRIIGLLILAIVLTYANQAFAVSIDSIDLESESTQYLVSASPTSDLKISGDLSIEFWYRPESTSAKHNIIDLRSQSGSNRYGYSFDINTNNSLVL